MTYNYSYDLIGNLGKVILPQGSSYSVHYSIDGVGRRVGRELVWGSDTPIYQYFVYDDQLRIGAELTATEDAAPRSVFVYGTKPNVPDYMYQGGVAYRIISDWAGSVRLVVNASNGYIEQQIDYDEFGNVLPPNSIDHNCTAMPCISTQPFGFAGGIQDVNTGLVRFGARDYDPQLGRWVSKDPIRFDGGQTNLYVYVGNDPVNARDIDGLDLDGGLLPGGTGPAPAPTPTPTPDPTPCPPPVPLSHPWECSAPYSINDIASSFISACCEARVHREFPGQLYNWTLGNILDCSLTPGPQKNACTKAWKILNKPYCRGDK